MRDQNISNSSEDRSDNDILDIHTAALREAELPEEGNEQGPWWLYVIIISTLAFGFFYMGFYFGEFSGEPHTLYKESETVVPEKAPELSKTELGKQVYGQVCQTCHQANGKGVPGVFPTLHNAPLASNNPKQLIGIILHGLEGELVRDNGTYNAMMPPWQDRLNDKEVAAVATWVRAEFSDISNEVTQEDVKEVRDLDKSSYWNQEELNESFPQSQ